MVDHFLTVIGHLHCTFSLSVCRRKKASQRFVVLTLVELLPSVLMAAAPGSLETPEGLAPLPFLLGPELPSVAAATDRWLEKAIMHNGNIVDRDKASLVAAMEEWPKYQTAAVGGMRKPDKLYLDPRIRSESLGPYPGISPSNDTGYLISKVTASSAHPLMADSDACGHALANDAGFGVTVSQPSCAQG